VHVFVVPTRVQGPGAAEEIAAAIALVNRLAIPIEILVVGRGGGSLEDLWSFNEEVVVRAIHASRIPVVSAVGHEIDVTLTDLVADRRALTPSEAAEIVVPSADDIRAGLRDRQTRLLAALRRRANQARERLLQLESRRPFRRPFDAVHDLAQQLEQLQTRAGRAVRMSIERSRHTATALAARLESLSPVGVLARGYSLTTRGSDGGPLTDASQLNLGEMLHTRFARGATISKIEQIL
jgi:exodeoxyribonuclease VII large subunit